MDSKLQRTEELKTRFTQAYHKALDLGLCESKGTFADFIGIARQNTSSAFSGQRISESIVVKAESAIKKAAGVDIFMVNTDNANGNTQKNFETLEDGIKNEDVREIVHELSQLLKEERESHERIMMAFIEKIK